MSEEGSGSLSCHPSTFFDLDDGGDIAMKGCYEDTSERFLKSGFTAQDHDWSYGGLKGFPVEFYETDFGPYSTFKFHSTPDAQELRVKCRERLEAGKTVSISIGYEAKDVEVIYPHQYETRLKEVLPQDKFESALQKARERKFSRIRLLKNVELYEYSVVVVPMNKNAAATGVKSSPVATTEKKVSEISVDLKGQYLGEYAGYSASAGAISRLSSSLMWGPVYDALCACGDCEEMDSAGRIAHLSGAFAEFSDMSLKVCQAMIDSGDDAGVKSVAESLKDIWPDPEGDDFATGSGSLTFGLKLAAAVSVAQSAVEHAESRAALRKGEKRGLSATNVEFLRGLKDRITVLIGDGDGCEEASGFGPDGKKSFVGDDDASLEAVKVDVLALETEALDLEAELVLAGI